RSRAMVLEGDQRQSHSPVAAGAGRGLVGALAQRDPFARDVLHRGELVGLGERRVDLLLGYLRPVAPGRSLDRRIADRIVGIALALVDPAAIEGRLTLELLGRGLLRG